MKNNLILGYLTHIRRCLEVVFYEHDIEEIEKDSVAYAMELCKEGSNKLRKNFICLDSILGIRDEVCNIIKYGSNSSSSHAALCNTNSVINDLFSHLKEEKIWKK